MNIIEVTLIFIGILLFWGMCWSVSEHEYERGRCDLLVMLETIDPSEINLVPLCLQKALMLSSYQLSRVTESLLRDGYLRYAHALDDDGCPRMLYKVTRLGREVLRLHAAPSADISNEETSIELVVDNTTKGSLEDQAAEV